MTKTPRLTRGPAFLSPQARFHRPPSPDDAEGELELLLVGGVGIAHGAQDAGEVPFFLLDGLPAHQLFLPEEEEGDEFALPVDAEEGQLVGEVLGDPVRVDGRVRGVRGEDAGFLKGAQDPEGLRWVVCLG